VGHTYEVRLVSFRAMKEPAHLALHPFGAIPTYEEWFRIASAAG
jgi:glutathione S-transferase